MPHIYVWSYTRVWLSAAAALLVWTVLGAFVPKKHWRRINAAALILAVYMILFYTALRRTPSDEHQLVFFSARSREFYREMLMNIFLYFPLGLSLAVLIGPWSILAGFVLSLGIETWQYFAGTGLAQGTDVICNTLGCAIGAIPAWIDGYSRRGRR